MTAVAILVAGCALVGLPPFSPFFSELLGVVGSGRQDFASDTDSCRPVYYGHDLG